MGDGDGEPAELSLRDGWVPECRPEVATPAFVYGACVARSDPIPVVVRDCWAAGWRNTSGSADLDDVLLARLLGSHEAATELLVPVASGAYDDALRPLVRLSDFIAASARLDATLCSGKPAPYLKDCHIALLRRAAAAGRSPDSEAAPGELMEPGDGLLIPPPFADDALNGFWRLRPQLQVRPVGCELADGQGSASGSAAAAAGCVATPVADDDDTMFLYAGGLGTSTGLHEDVVASHSWSASLRGAKAWMFWPPGRAAAIGLADASGDALVDDPRSAGPWAAIGAEFRKGLQLRCSKTAQLWDAPLAGAAWEAASAALPPMPKQREEMIAAAAAPLVWRNSHSSEGGGVVPGPGAGAVALLVQWPGDVVFVPAGWHHAVYNLPFDGVSARGRGPPLCISVNANWLSGSALPGLAALVLREVATARRLIADCTGPGLVAAGLGVHAARVDAGWEWQCQRMVRASARLDVADVCQLVFARAGTALLGLGGAHERGSAHCTDRAEAWEGAPPSAFDPMQPALRLPGHAQLLQRMHRDAAKGALEAIALLRQDPLVAWLRSQPEAADAQCRRQARDVRGEPCAWSGESAAFDGCRMLGLGWFWHEHLVAALREACAPEPAKTSAGGASE